MPDPLPAQPRRQLAVLTCMDARIDPLAGLGLELGDAHVLRNAGGLPTEDMLRSLAISQRRLGTREIRIVQHTKCGMQGFDDVAFRAECGDDARWDVPGFDDVEASVRGAVATVRGCGFLVHRDAVSGWVYDVDTGALTPAE